ncbi:MAG: succinate dehydrogenase, cytochrome b556 subunit [Pseudomonadota bacterium]
MTNRPISPHIQIYRPQITSILSITHRFTGIALTLASCIFCVGLFSFALSETAWEMFISTCHLMGGKIWQWPLIFAVHYHAMNGIRHLAWDMGYGFNIKTVTQTSILVIILSIMATLSFAHFCSIL